MKTSITTAALAAMALPLLMGPAGAQTAPTMTVLIKGGPAGDGKGSIDVVETLPDVEIAAGAPFLSMSTFVPGQSTAQPVTNLTVTDDQGAVPVTGAGGQRGRWTANRAVKGTLKVGYHLPIQDTLPVAGGPPTNLRVDGDGFSGQGGTILMVPAVTKPYRIALKWDVQAMGPAAEGVSSYGDGDQETPTAVPLKQLDNIVLMAGGHVQREPAKGSPGAFSAVWIGNPPFDPHESMHWTGELHAWMSKFFHDKTEPTYRVFLRYNPMNAGGGAALLHSFIATYGTGVTGENLKGILGHEMTHTWTSNSLGKWYNEGDAVYSQALLPWRAHLFTTQQYLEDINETASRYYTDTMKSTPESQVVENFWKDTRIRVLPYDRGALYFTVLSSKIRKASGGKRSVDTLVQEMIDRVREGKPISEAVWVGMLQRELGPEGPAIHKNMMSGGLVLPDSDAYGPCFRRVVKKIRIFDLGFDMSTMVNPDKIVHGLEPGSEAAKAGIRNGDKIAYGIALDALQGEVNRTFTVHVTRDGKTFDVTYLPRGQAVDAYQWELIPGIPDSKCRI